MSSEDAQKQERYYIEQLKANLNNNRPIITAEKKKEQMKQCYVKNSNILKQLMKQWKTNNPEYYKEYNKSDKYKQNKKPYRENKKLQDFFFVIHFKQIYITLYII